MVITGDEDRGRRKKATHGALRSLGSWLKVTGKDFGANGPLLTILIAGAILRFYSLNMLSHGYDQAYPIYDALRILDGGQLLLVGQPSSVFLDNPALMSYIQAIPLLFWRSPWAVYLFITALNTVAIWFVYRVAQKLLGRPVGLLAAFFFAVNPWVINFSTITWVQALLPLFMAVVAWGLWPAAVRSQQRASAPLSVAGLAVIAMTQTYVLAMGVLLQVGLVLLLFYRRLPRRPLYASFVVLVTAMTVYGGGLASQWETNEGKLAEFSAEGELRITREGLDHAVRLVTGQNFMEVFNLDETSDYEARQALSRLAHYLISLALAAGVMRALLALWRREQTKDTALVLLIWFAIPIVLMSITPYMVHPHYLLLSLPAGHLLAAWGLAPFMRRPILKWGTFCALLLIAVLFGLNTHRAVQESARNPAAPDLNGWLLADGAALGEIVRELASTDTSPGEEAHPRRIYAKSDETLLSSLSGTYVTTMRELDYPSHVVLPGKEPLLYVLVNTPPDQDALGPLQKMYPEHGLQLDNGTYVSFQHAFPYSRMQALALPQTVIDWPSDAGLTILGYDIMVNSAAQPGLQTIDTTLYWRVEELHPERNQWFVTTFYHLVNDEGQIVANVPGYGQQGYRWQPGDVYVQRVSIPFTADLEPGKYQIVFGLFDPVQSRNFYLHSPDGPVYAMTESLIAEKTGAHQQTHRLRLVDEGPHSSVTWPRYGDFAAIQGLFQCRL